MSDYELLLDAKAQLGEGPVWDARVNKLYWLDILSRVIHVYDPAARRDEILAVPRLVTCLAPRAAGGFVAAGDDGFFSFDPESGRWTPILDPEADKPGNRFNDGKCDPSGRFWAGTMLRQGKETGAAALYCLEKDLRVRKVIGNITLSNGLGWSPAAARMYYIDTPTREVSAFDYVDRTGQISNRRAAVAVPEGMGFPDGMTVDEEGKLWVCHWGAACVCRWDPDSGRLLHRQDLPARNISCCTFGGPNLDELYVTSARLGMDAAQLRACPLSGALFRLKPGVRGMPTNRFAG